MVCPSWLSFILHNPLRSALTDRYAAAAESGITDKSTVIEVGAGNGFFTEVLALKACRVYAVELQAGMVRKLRQRLGAGGGNVVVVHGDISRWRGGSAFADVCLLYYSFHEVSDKEGAIDNIAEMLRPGGLVALYEPTIEVNHEKMKKTVAMFTGRGFGLEACRNGFFTRFARLRKQS